MRQGIYQVTIPNGDSISNSQKMLHQKLLAIQMSASWDAANITFQASTDGTTFGNLYDEADLEWTIVGPGANDQVLLNEFPVVRHLKVRSGTSAVPVVQTADRIITLITGE